MVLWYINVMKKIHLLFIIISFLLTGCFGTSDSTSPSEKKAEGFHLYSTSEFSMLIPDEWEVLMPVKFKSDVPENTLIAFRNNVQNEKFTASVIVMKNELSEEGVSTEDYAKMLQQKIKEELSGVNEIQAEDVFYYIEGREQPENELKKFMQFSAVKGKNAYVVLGAFLATDTEDTAKKTETMVRSFSVK